MSANFNLTSASALFKIKYDKLSENVYNSATPLLARIKKSYDFTGKTLQITVPRSFAGGVGSGSLPTANTAIYSEATFSAKKVYAVVELDRETMKAAMSDEGSFVRATKEVVKKGVESWMRNMSRILFHDGTGSVGVLEANATGSAAAPVCLITAASFKEANFEEKDILNNAATTEQYEVTSVDPDNRLVTLARLTGSTDLTSTGSGITLHMQGPNLIVTSYLQFEKLLNILEDQKQYTLEPRAKDLKGQISFNGISFMSSRGAIGIFADRFCENDRMYFLNDDKIQIYHRPDFGWFDDDFNNSTHL